jgi:hypothetical protein
MTGALNQIQFKTQQKSKNKLTLKSKIWLECAAISEVEFLIANITIFYIKMTCCSIADQPDFSSRISH